MSAVKNAAVETTSTSRLIEAGITERFHADGLSIADWARSKGFSVRLVYSVVRGERKCLRGQSHFIAKELGMK